MGSTQYDIVIVGAGIAGSALAHALSTIRPSSAPPLKIALLERSLAEPDRIVGELLQPGGVHALRALGLEWTLEDIGAIPVHGYCVVREGQAVRIPYPGANEGRSFHHGRFVMQLRRAALAARGVEVVEATVNDLVECEATGHVIGARATRKGAGHSENFLADIIFAADGSTSKFRKALGKNLSSPSVKSHFVGAVLEGTGLLPISQHGTVVLVPGSGPVLMYQIEENDTRILIDIKSPLPRDLQTYIKEKVVPFLPSTCQIPVLNAMQKQRLRSMPNAFLPAVMQGQPSLDGKSGLILLGDAWNMRHPLTGGGMTVALSDVVELTRLLTPVLSIIPTPDTPSPLADWSRLVLILHEWHWSRKPLAAMVNILSVALYDLFGGDDHNLRVLQQGCFKYFELGGDCVTGPVSLLSGLAPRPLLLMYHFFRVAFYSIWVLFTHPRPSPAFPHSDSDIKKNVRMITPSVGDYPALFIESICVFWTACVVFGPLLWSEIRWW
ncbi:hypothetical protein BOTBODRAFT_39657 [Botryobasidium botryosum FD-172 SS1]|uniref:Squalene monooxygenase n=1 Tax=Botryobasidium botryosum (strain FD-172 SS1) TaxID=930990 RepID=A0A067M3F1_BOTB1|nr:hypothetical protein BOTBODRAFT_39657 [Botryobasidium botryosum FD-172 SS1]